MQQKINTFCLNILKPLLKPGVNYKIQPNIIMDKDNPNEIDYKKLYYLYKNNIIILPHIILQ